MPKAKKVAEVENKEETKEILLDDEEKTVDPDVLSDDMMSDDEDEDGVIPGLDDEVDPFKDRWEE